MLSQQLYIGYLLGASACTLCCVYRKRRKLPAPERVTAQQKRQLWEEASGSSVGRTLRRHRAKARDGGGVSQSVLGGSDS